MKTARVLGACYQDDEWTIIRKGLIEIYNGEKGEKQTKTYMKEWILKNDGSTKSTHRQLQKEKVLESVQLSHEYVVLIGKICKLQ